MTHQWSQIPCTPTTAWNRNKKVWGIEKLVQHNSAEEKQCQKLCRSQYQSPNFYITPKKSDTIILHRTFNCKCFHSSYIIIFLSIFAVLNLATEKPLKPAKIEVSNLDHYISHKMVPRHRDMILYKFNSLRTIQDIKYFLKKKKQISRDHKK